MLADDGNQIGCGHNNLVVLADIVRPQKQCVEALLRRVLADMSEEEGGDAMGVPSDVLRVVSLESFMAERFGTKSSTVRVDKGWLTWELRARR